MGASSTKPSWWTTLRDALSGKEQDCTKGNLSRAVFVLAIPMVLETSMESLFSICDIFWVSKLSSEAVAAVGLTESVLTLYYAIAVGLSIAVTAMVARRVGEKRDEDASQAGAQAIYLGLIVGVVSGVVLALFAPNILGLMGAAPEVVQEGSTYTRIILSSNVVILLLFLNNAIFRGAGDPALAMRALWLGNGINLVLDPCLIFGFGPIPAMGLTGAAIASVIGRSVAVFYQFYHLRRGTGRVRLAGESVRWVPALAMRLLRVSAGGIGQMAIATTSWVILMRLMSQFGSNVLAGYTIAIRIIVFTILPSWGLANAAATLVGQHLGAKMPDRAARAVIITGVYNMAFLLVVMAVFLLFGERLIRIFTNDPEEIAVGVQCLRVFSYGYVFYGWGMVMTQAFNGSGDTGTPTLLNLIAFWIVQLPLAWWLAFTWDLGPSGVFWAVIVADTVLTLLAFVMFRRGRWKGSVV